MYRIWHSTENFADYVVENTELQNFETEKKQLPESDVNSPSSFHRVPDHIKEILYLDAPDLIVEKDGRPVFTVEISQEAGTGHNAFQRFPRIAASVESDIPALYIYPEATFVRRKDRNSWDEINPNIFRSLENVMQIYDVPALLFYYPTEFDEREVPEQNKGLVLDDEINGQPNREDSEMKSFFRTVNLAVKRAERAIQRPFIKEREVRERRNWMQREYYKKGGESGKGSPISATKTIPTEKILNYMKEEAPDAEPEIFSGREETVIYQANAAYRGDPYPGALSAIDYLMCRTGKTYEDRDKNLMMCWGKVEEKDETIAINASENAANIEDFVERVKRVVEESGRFLLDKDYGELDSEQIPRYYMQVRHGTKFTQTKPIRIYAYFADGILFKDGTLWREG